MVRKVRGLVSGPGPAVGSGHRWARGRRIDGWSPGRGRTSWFESSPLEREDFVGQSPPPSRGRWPRRGRRGPICQELVANFSTSTFYRGQVPGGGRVVCKPWWPEVPSCGIVLQWKVAGGTHFGCRLAMEGGPGALLRHRLAMEGGWRYPLWGVALQWKVSGGALPGGRPAIQGGWKCPHFGQEAPSSATRTPGPGLLEWQIGRPGPHVVQHRLVVSH